jgi:energy-coupling factor transporter ATP-binding protein EcfA2
MATKAQKNLIAKKSLLEQILDWSKSDLKPWQQDAARRLFHMQTAELPQKDLDELYQLMKSANGVPGATEAKPEPLSEKHLPSAAVGADVILKTLRDLKHVNRIAPSQTLAFAGKGLTVVYGANGSGKSGYSRVMKRACRARDQSEPVLPDATEPAGALRIPAAIFDVTIGGQSRSIQWKHGDVGSEELSTIAVFDGRCARAYLTAENEVAYLPYGLDVIEGLANKVLPAVSGMLKAEIRSINVDRTPFNHLVDETKVGVCIGALGPKTKESDIRALAKVTTEESDKLASLTKILGEADPRAKAKALRLSSSRIAELVARMNASAGKVSSAVVDQLLELDRLAVAAAEADRLAAVAFQASDVLLPGTGEGAWKALFEAARKYSTEIAYPGHAFPHVGDGGVCVLCQQDIAGASDRMARFAAFVQQDTAKAAGEAIKKQKDAVRAVRTSDVGVQLNDALGSELKDLEEGLSEAVTLFETQVRDIQKWAVEASEAHDWLLRPEITSDPRVKLTAFSEGLLASAKALEVASDETERKKMAAQAKELAARTLLSNCVDAVCELVGRTRMKEALERCEADLKTTGISHKARTLASDAVTGKLKAALDREFEALGAGHIGTRLVERNDKGKIKHRLLLDLPSSNKLEEILSEGEQRAVAIGSFMAELDLAQHSGGVVFDDPVSSLDHYRKERIAKRLAAEGARRQVIVFTHDMVFLRQLVEEGSAVKCEVVTHWLERDGDGRSGKVKSDDSPAGGKAYRDTKRAQASLKRAEGLAGDERVSAIRQGMGELRRTVEEIVPHHLFKNVVARWREKFMIANVKTIRWDDTLADEIDALFAELSRHFEGHSHSEEYMGAPPELGDLKTLIRRVDDVINRAKPQR